MKTRKYIPEDCEQLAELFYNTVHTVNAIDYKPEQLNVWATGKVDLKEWNRSFLRNNTVVAIEGETIVGFGDMDESGYLDRLYVHKDYQRKGIGTAICNVLENAASVNEFTVQASITAKPFFLSRGYLVVSEQEVKRDSIALTNYIMAKHVNK